MVCTYPVILTMFELTGSLGTPRTYHYENSRDALLAGKHVLCEKPFTSNAAELRELIKLAKERSLFLMEAIWTRLDRKSVV